MSLFLTASYSEDLKRFSELLFVLLIALRGINQVLPECEFQHPLAIIRVGRAKHKQKEVGFLVLDCLWTPLGPCYHEVSAFLLFTVASRDGRQSVRSGCLKCKIGCWEIYQRRLLFQGMWRYLSTTDDNNSALNWPCNSIQKRQRAWSSAAVEVSMLTAAPRLITAAHACGIMCDGEQAFKHTCACV